MRGKQNDMKIAYGLKTVCKRQFAAHLRFMRTTKIKMHLFIAIYVLTHVMKCDANRGNDPRSLSVM